jgi:ABC-type dipeptide/oligopeptide/nickel transport system permease component
MQFLTLYTAAVVVLVNLIVDLSYGFIDPRVRYS